MSHNGVSLEALTKYYTYRDLDGQSIVNFTGKEPVLYANVVKYKTLKALLGKENFVIILYETSDATTGHWVSITFNDKLNTVYFYDSYGYKPDYEKSVGAVYASQYPNWITNLLDNSGVPYEWNKEDLQARGKVATCGHWATISSKLLRNLSINEFNNLFLMNSVPVLQPDFCIVLMSLVALNEIRDYFD